VFCKGIKINGMEVKEKGNWEGSSGGKEREESEGEERKRR
jgi:hypothetical protein